MMNENKALTVGRTNYALADMTVSINSHYDAVMAIKGFENLSEVNTKAIALVVKQISEKKIFEEAGYKTLAEYVKDTFGYSKGHVSSMLKVVNRFLKEGTTTKYSENGRDFTYTQLRALTRLEDDEIVKYISDGSITFDSTVKEIETLINKRSAVSGEVVGEGETTIENESTENDTTEKTEPKYNLVEVIINGHVNDIGTIETQYTEKDIVEKAPKGAVTAIAKGKNTITEFVLDKKTHVTTVNTFKLIEG